MTQLRLLVVVLSVLLAMSAYAEVGPATVVTSGSTIVFDSNTLNCTLDDTLWCTASEDPVTKDAVFQFESLEIQAGAMVTVTGYRTLVLESQSAITLDAVIDISAPDVNDEPDWMTNIGGEGGPAGGYAGGDLRSNGEGPGYGRYVVNAGSGAGYGGLGGRNGRTDTGVGEIYGDEKITMLYGGSGGGGGHQSLFASVGGGGGGGIGLTAATDIAIGDNGGILSEGAMVWSLPHQLNGGGGSGGSIRLVANSGTITVDGVLSVNGGKGGDISAYYGETSAPQTKTGGGGAGGRIAFYSADGTVQGSGTITATGGEPGYYYRYEGSPDADLRAEVGGDGTIAYFSEPYVAPDPTLSGYSPGDGAVEVSIETALGWDVDFDYYSYDVYFSSDYSAVEEMGVDPITVIEPNVTSEVLPDLERGTWYYWKVVGQISADGTIIESEIQSFKTETYKITFDTDALIYSIEDGASGAGCLFSYYHAEEDANNPDIPVAKFVLDDFNFGSQWEIVATGQYPLWIESTGDLVFNGIADLSGYAPDGLDSALKPGDSGPYLVLGGYPGSYRGTGDYASEVGQGPGAGVNCRYGGGGAGYGGVGGNGQALETGGPAYGSPELTYLLGGSGGGGADACSGGSGGGVLALVASGDIDIQSTAEIRVDGGMGGDDGKSRERLTGGGGSAGSLLIVASGTVNIDGLVSAQGGDGYPCPAGQHEAGGAGGGRIAIYATDANYTGSGIVTVAGGESGRVDGSTTDPNLAQDGQPGTLYFGTDYTVELGALLVDNFEGYHNTFDPCDDDVMVYDVWKDGYKDSGNGSVIGNLNGAPMETDDVHGGLQAAPLEYDNRSVDCSEITARTSDLSIGSDWSAVDPATLTLWIYGDDKNDGQLYVEIDGQPFTCSIDLAVEEWQECSIDLSTSGLDLGNVTTLTIGIEGDDAEGTLLIDDIALSRPGS